LIIEKAKSLFLCFNLVEIEEQTTEEEKA